MDNDLFYNVLAAYVPLLSHEHSSSRTGSSVFQRFLTTTLTPFWDTFLDDRKVRNTAIGIVFLILLNSTGFLKE